MASVNAAVFVPQPDRAPPQPRVSVSFIFVVLKWAKREGFMWDNFWSFPAPAIPFSFDNWAGDKIPVIVDPLTAIATGMVTAEQLEYPPGILAAFNLLSKEPS